MEPYVLNKEQLNQLREFIKSRSPRFAEPMIMQEILDHFACKTEELMTSKPGISFQEAMTSAHKSFGIRGFSPIADHLEAQLLKRYRRIALAEAKSILLSFHIVGIAASGILVFLLVRHLMPYVSGKWIIFIFDIPLLVGSIAFTAVQHHKWKRRKQYKLLPATAFRATPAFIFGNYFFTVCLSRLLFEDMYTTATSYFFAIVSLLSVFNFLLQSRVMKKAVEEADASALQLQAADNSITH